MWASFGGALSGTDPVISARRLYRVCRDSAFISASGPLSPHAVLTLSVFEMLLEPQRGWRKSHRRDYAEIAASENKDWSSSALLPQSLVGQESTAAWVCLCNLRPKSFGMLL